MSDDRTCLEDLFWSDDRLNRRKIGRSVRPNVARGALEHGVGLAKQPYIPLEMKPEQIAAMQAIKKALDPNNILNPGKMFPVVEMFNHR